MKAAYTSGPWTHTGHGDIMGIENDPENGCVGPVDVASVYLRTVPGRHEANANLVAAAPELLQALQDLLVLYQRKRPGLWGASLDQVKAAKAAIQKATGAA